MKYESFNSLAQPLTQAISNGDIDKISELYGTASETDISYALATAAYFNHEIGTGIAIEHGADISGNKYFPLFIAAKLGNVEVLNLLQTMCEDFESYTISDEMIQSESDSETNSDYETDDEIEIINNKRIQLKYCEVDPDLNFEESFPIKYEFLDILTGRNICYIQSSNIIDAVTKFTLRRANIYLKTPETKSIAYNMICCRCSESSLATDDDNIDWMFYRKLHIYTPRFQETMDGLELELYENKYLDEIFLRERIIIEEPVNDNSTNNALFRSPYLDNMQFDVPSIGFGQEDSFIDRNSGNFSVARSEESGGPSNEIIGTTWRRPVPGSQRITLPDIAARQERQDDDTDEDNGEYDEGDDDDDDEGDDEEINEEVEYNQQANYTDATWRRMKIVPFNPTQIESNE